jgi:predicted phosphodiesterase
MKIGIVSDTHSNYHALQSVLEHMNEIGVDKKVHLGDVVGYGPKPSETLELTLEEFNYIVMGNHDLAVVYEEESLGFNPQARYAVDWTREKLSKHEIEVLKNLAYKHKVGDALFVHGSPSAGRPHDYIIDHSDAKFAFGNTAVDFKVAFVGHTHQPFLWGVNGYKKISHTGNRSGVSELSLKIPNEEEVIVNVGAVGQPRDGDPRASYVIYDTEENTVTWYRVPYAVDRTVALMQRAGFSSNACERLLFGR